MHFTNFGIHLGPINSRPPSSITAHQQYTVYTRFSFPQSAQYTVSTRSNITHMAHNKTFIIGGRHDNNMSTFSDGELRSSQTLRPLTIRLLSWEPWRTRRIVSGYNQDWGHEGRNVAQSDLSCRHVFCGGEEGGRLYTEWLSGSMSGLCCLMGTIKWCLSSTNWLEKNIVWFKMYASQVGCSFLSNTICKLIWILLSGPAKMSGLFHSSKPGTLCFVRSALSLAELHVLHRNVTTSEYWKLQG